MTKLEVECSQKWYVKRCLPCGGLVTVLTSISPEDGFSVYLYTNSCCCADQWTRLPGFVSQNQTFLTAFRIRRERELGLTWTQWRAFLLIECQMRYMDGFGVLIPARHSLPSHTGSGVWFKKFVSGRVLWPQLGTAAFLATSSISSSRTELKWSALSR